MKKYFIYWYIIIPFLLAWETGRCADSTSNKQKFHIGLGVRYYTGSRNYYLPTNYFNTIGKKFPQLFEYYFQPWCPSIIVSTNDKNCLLNLSIYGNKIKDGHFVGASLSYLVPIYKGLFIGGSTNHSYGQRRNIMAVVDNVEYPFSHHEQEYLSVGIELNYQIKINKIRVQLSASTYYFEQRRFWIKRGNRSNNEIFDRGLVYSRWLQPFFRNLNLAAHVTF